MYSTKYTIDKDGYNIATNCLVISLDEVCDRAEAHREKLIDDRRRKLAPLFFGGEITLLLEELNDPKRRMKWMISD